MYNWFHYAIAHEKVQIDKDDYFFIADVLSGFDQSIKSALLTETLGEKTENAHAIFSFPEWNYHELYNSGSKDAFDAIKKKWKSSRKHMGNTVKK